MEEQQPPENPAFNLELWIGESSKVRREFQMFWPTPNIKTNLKTVYSGSFILQAQSYAKTLSVNYSRLGSSMPVPRISPSVAPNSLLWCRGIVGAASSVFAYRTASESSGWFTAGSPVPAFYHRRVSAITFEIRFADINHPWVTLFGDFLPPRFSIEFFINSISLTRPTKFSKSIWFGPRIVRSVRSGHRLLVQRWPDMLKWSSLLKTAQHHLINAPSSSILNSPAKDRWSRSCDAEKPSGKKRNWKDIFEDRQHWLAH